jgi:hypothetical protein
MAARSRNERKANEAPKAITRRRKLGGTGSAMVVISGEARDVGVMIFYCIFYCPAAVVEFSFRRCRICATA